MRSEFHSIPDRSETSTPYAKWTKRGNICKTMHTPKGSGPPIVWRHPWRPIELPTNGHCEWIVKGTDLEGHLRLATANRLEP